MICTFSEYKSGAYIYGDSVIAVILLWITVCGSKTLEGLSKKKRGYLLKQYYNTLYSGKLRHFSKVSYLFCVVMHIK